VPPEQRAEVDPQIAELRIKLMRVGFELETIKKANLNRIEKSSSLSIEIKFALAIANT
jgi:hypothetical protein